VFNSTQEDANMVSKTIWRLPEVMGRTGLPRSTIYHKMSQNEFPQSINLGVRSVGWIADEVEQFLTDCVNRSRQDDEE